MTTGVNVRKVISTDLLAYNRLIQERQASWHDIDYEEMELIKGTGSDDCGTELNVINTHPAWHELIDLQREKPETCEVHIFCEGGYIACHRVILQQSNFMKQLITSNLKTNTPCCNNIIGITFEVNLEVMKRVVSLMYTGSCIISDNKEEDEVKDVLRRIQLDLEKIEKIPDPRFQIGNSQKKKMKTVVVHRYQQNDNDSPFELASTDINQVGLNSAAQTTMPASSGVTKASSSIPASMPTSSSSSSRGLAFELPEMTKVPPGTLISKKPARRIQRYIQNSESCTSSTSKRVDNNDSDSDEPSAQIPPLPEIRKVAPGTLLPLNKQPRIIRQAQRCGHRRGGGIKKSIDRRWPASNEAPTVQVNDNYNTSKRNDEQDFPHVPSRTEETNKVDEMDQEMESAEGNGQLQPWRGVTNALQDDGANGYSKKRCQEENSVTDHNPPENSSTTMRTRGMGMPSNRDVSCGTRKKAHHRCSTCN